MERDSTKLVYTKEDLLAEEKESCQDASLHPWGGTVEVLWLQSRG